MPEVPYGTTQAQYNAAGPLEQPYIQRSRYLQQALAEMQQSANQIRSPSELGTRLIAQALMQYANRRNENRRAKAQTLDFQANPDVAFMTSALGTPNTDPTIGMGAGTSPTGGAGLSAAPPAPQPMATTPAPAPDYRGAKTRDALVRLMIGEDRNPTGQQAVANVVMNRAATGMDPADVITQRGQFEPYGNAATWNRLQQIPTTDPRYQQAEQALAAAQQQDITGGANHFFGAQTQAALGRQAPAWSAGGDGRQIGGNTFFNRPFAPPSGYQPPQATPSPAPPPTQQEAPPAASPPPAGPAGGQPAPVVQESQIPRSYGNRIITPEVVQRYQQLASNPATYQEAAQLAAQIRTQASAPIHWSISQNPDRNGMVTYSDPLGIFGSFQVPVAGFRPDPNDAFTRDASGNVVVQQGHMTRPAQGGEMTGIAPGAAVDIGPTGARNVVSAPPTGYQRTPTGLTPERGGPNDITAPQNAVPTMITIQTQLRPILDTVTDLNHNISAARAGYQAQNGSGDIALMNGLQHLTDTGIVRQEDMTNQLHGMGLPGTAAGMIQWLQGGGQFTPAQRTQLLRMAEGLYAPALSGARARVEGYRGILNQLGPNAYDTVVPPSLRQEWGWEPRAQQPGRPGQPHPQATPRPAQPSRPRGRIISVQ